MEQRMIPHPLSLFCVAAPKDSTFLEQWENHLLPLQQAGYLTIWSEQHIQAGTDRIGTLLAQMEQADAITFLLSADFFKDETCLLLIHQARMQQNLKPLQLIPLLIRPVAWEKSDLGKCTSLPANGAAITTWVPFDQGWRQAVHDLEHLLGLPVTEVVIAPQSSIKKGWQYAASALTYLILPSPRHSSLSTTLIQQNRLRMRQKLEKWYQNFLDDSLDQAIWLELGLVEKPDMLANPISLLVRNASLPERPLPTGTTIIQVYEQAHQELLILGDPGAGKSTQLYILARHLLALTETDQKAPLPFIFALSSWASKQNSLETWMAEQLLQMYQVPKKVAEQWIQNQQILPLLDGLDEIEEGARPQCIQEINRYHQKYTHPLVVCSRSAEYANATHDERLALQQAVVLEPLNQKQVTKTLIKGGRGLAGLRASYKNSPDLQDLATTPLLLNILILTYQGTSVKDMPKQRNTLLRHVLRTYVECMIMRKGNNRYPPVSMERWLTFLASQMRKNHLTSYAIEQLQPDWLLPISQRGYRVSVILLFGLLVFLDWGLVFGLFGLFQGIRTGLQAGLIMGLGGLGTGLVIGVINTREKTITLAEHIQWPWNNIRHEMLFLLTIGPMIVFFSNLLFWHIPWTNASLIPRLLAGLIAGPIFLLFLEIVPSEEIDRTTRWPEEGVWNSLKNGLSTWLSFLLLSILLGPIFTVVFGPSIGLLHGLLVGVLFGVTFGFFFGLFLGLSPFFLHIVLRFWLWRSNLLPFYLVPFLEDAHTCHLLKRAGGTYQFMHRLLLDYFADHESY